MSDEKPKCTDITVGSSVGGKVQIVKFENTQEFNFWMGGTYSIPEGWSEQDVKDFRQDKIIEIRTQLEGVAQAEMDDLMEQRDNLN